jgi:hypothetical protein
VISKRRPPRDGVLAHVKHWPGSVAEAFTDTELTRLYRTALARSQTRWEADSSRAIGLGTHASPPRPFAPESASSA